jgi:hypothetical protein
MGCRVVGVMIVYASCYWILIEYTAVAVIGCLVVEVDEVDSSI